MKITKYPQSCFLIEEKKAKILIDPGFYVFEIFDPRIFFGVDVILISHKHRDHCDMAAIKEILKNSGNKVVVLCNNEVSGILEKEGVKADVIEAGMERKIKGIVIKAVAAQHGELPDGQAGPEGIGFLINRKVYHAGDCIYMDDKPEAKVVLVPIGGQATMNPKEAKMFVDEGGYEIAIPMHYNNPDHPVNDPKIFAEEMVGSTAVVIVLKDGDSVDI